MRSYDKILTVKRIIAHKVVHKRCHAIRLASDFLFFFFILISVIRMHITNRCTHHNHNNHFTSQSC